MFVLPPSTRVFLCTLPTDMRKSFDGLAAMTRDLVIQNPLSGHLFVFRNRNGDRLKVLYWDRAGFCLFYKRLEKGTFRFPPAPARCPPAEPAAGAGIPGGGWRRPGHDSRRHRDRTRAPSRSFLSAGFRQAYAMI